VRWQPSLDDVSIRALNDAALCSSLFAGDRGVWQARATLSRVPRRRKLILVGLVGYLALFFGLLSDVIPIPGQPDDAIIVALVLRHFVKAGGDPLIRELWPGPQTSLELILRLARA
jgi:uncharacterized membrane protein YkvA (DUF1232 family)